MSRALITGGDGHVGRAVARWLLDNSDCEVLLFVRGRSWQERAAKNERLGDLALNARCRVFYGDLADEKPFAGIAAAGITDIVHCAAVTNFAVDRDTARGVNVDGTAKLLEFASTCRSLRRFGFVSSIYAAGLARGDLREEPVVEPESFANHYEWSKWEGERLLYGRSDIPWQIFRVATILGEDETGTVVQHNVIHNTLRLLFYGLLPVIPGDPATRVYFVSTAFAAQAIGRILIEGDTRTVYHISDTGEAAMSLGTITDTVYDAFVSDPEFSRQHILKPRYCDAETFAALQDGIGQFGGFMSQALSSVSPFAPQLYCDKAVHTRSTTAVLGGLQSTDPRNLLRAVADRLVETRWGLNRQRGNAPCGRSNKGRNAHRSTS